MHNRSQSARELTLEFGEADEFFAGSESNVAAGRPPLPPGIDQIREELDALMVLGVDPIKSLVVPRFLSLMLLTPLFTIYALLFGILGGVLGGWVFGMLGIWPGGGMIGSIIVAFVGAVILVAITRLLKRA